MKLTAKEIQLGITLVTLTCKGIDLIEQHHGVPRKDRLGRKGLDIINTGTNVATYLTNQAFKSFK